MATKQHTARVISELKGERVVALSLVRNSNRNVQHSESTKQTIEALETLLQEARAGRLDGLAWAALSGTGATVGVAGEAVFNANFTRGILRALDDKLGRHIAFGEEL